MNLYLSAVRVMDRLAQRVADRFRRATLTHLGRLPIGQTGSAPFGHFILTWRVEIDHVAWELTDTSLGGPPRLKGALKYVGWNRLDGQFDVFCHDWPSVRAALNYVYYEIGPQIGLEADVADGSWTDPAV